MSQASNSNNSPLNIKKRRPLILLNRQTSSGCPLGRMTISKREKSLANPEYVELYPKQIKSVVNRKKIDIIKMSRSLKTPGKRNYKSHIVNMRKLGFAHTKRVAIST